MRWTRRLSNVSITLLRRALSGCIALFLGASKCFAPKFFLRACAVLASQAPKDEKRVLFYELQRDRWSKLQLRDAFVLWLVSSKQVFGVEKLSLS